MTRAVCAVCGGWVDCGADFASWAARQKDFWRLHTHPAGAPQVYRWPGTESDRDAFAAALATLGLVNAGYAPLGGPVLAIHAKKSDGSLARIIARVPADVKL